MKRLVNRLVDGVRQNVLEDMTAQEEADFEAGRAAVRAARTIPLDVFARAVKAEGLFDALSDHMSSTVARRRIWDEMRMTRDPIPQGSQAVRNMLTTIGATAEQIARIMDD